MPRVQYSIAHSQHVWGNRPHAVRPQLVRLRVGFAEGALRCARGLQEAVRVVSAADDVRRQQGVQQALGTLLRRARDGAAHDVLEHQVQPRVPGCPPLEERRVAEAGCARGVERVATTPLCLLQHVHHLRPLRRRVRLRRRRRLGAQDEAGDVALRVQAAAGADDALWHHAPALQQLQQQEVRHVVRLHRRLEAVGRRVRRRRRRKHHAGVQHHVLDAGHTLRLLQLRHLRRAAAHAGKVLQVQLDGRDRAATGGVELRQDGGGARRVHAPAAHDQVAPHARKLHRNVEPDARRAAGDHGRPPAQIAVQVDAAARVPRPLHEAAQQHCEAYYARHSQHKHQQHTHCVLRFLYTSLS
eukprot:Rhum_TRINITY_DN24924_c0_g1::Rhum_TRINITY_DN24924_c0_g1_i1::g.180615::m.180615